MKCRAGFVSNSSSSSFVVAFPFIPHNMEEVKELLFAGVENPNPNFTIDEYAATIFSNIAEQLPLSFDEVVETFCEGYFIDMDDWEKENREKLQAAYNANDGALYRKYNEEYKNVRKSRAENAAKEWVLENKNGIFFKFEYGDDYGAYYSTMEHGNMFRKIPHKMISLH